MENIDGTALTSHTLKWQDAGQICGAGSLFTWAVITMLFVAP